MAAPKPNEHKPRAPKSQPSSQTFEFITLIDSNKIGEHDRYTVRKQAMKNNTNRRIKGAKSPSESIVQSEKTLTGPPVRQQAAQLKRFRLLPRGLQDLQERPKVKVMPEKFTGKGRFETQSQLEEEWWEVDSMAESDRGGTLDPMLDPVLHDIDRQVQWNVDGQVKREVHATHHDRDEKIPSDMTVSQYTASYLDRIPTSLNPMATLPDGASKRTRTLIQHNFTDTSRSNSLMMSVRKSWFLLSLTDIAFFYVCLSHYACTYCLLTGEGDPLESISYTARSIKIIKERLNKPELATNDGTIATVAGMVLHEIKIGNVVAVKAHLNGLQRMVSLRGGIRKARFPAPLQRMIAWAELNASSVFSTTPRILPVSSPALSIPSYICTTVPPGPLSNTNPNTHPNRAIFWDVIETDISKVFIDLRYISSILESENPKDAEQIDNMWYSDKTYLVQRSLVYLSQHPQSGSDRLDSLMCRAASIYVDSSLRDQRFSAAAIGILVSKLMAETHSFLLSQERDLFKLDDGDGGSDRVERLKRLTWIFAFGAIASLKRELERGWFVWQFGRACESLGVGEWESAEAMLRETLWNEKWEVPKGALWRDVLGRRME